MHWSAFCSFLFSQSHWLLYFLLPAFQPLSPPRFAPYHPFSPQLLGQAQYLPVPLALNSGLCPRNPLDIRVTPFPPPAKERRDLVLTRRRWFGPVQASSAHAAPGITQSLKFLHPTPGYI